MSGPFGSSQWMYNAGGGFYPYEIDQSLRFNDNDSAYLSRTPVSTGSRRTFTLSAWVKRSELGTGISNRNSIFGSGDTATTNGIIFKFQDDKLDFVCQGGATSRVTSTAVYRDASAWYHCVLSVDTTQATASNRVKMYVNGEQITSFTNSGYPSQNTDLNINTSSYAMRLGAESDASSITNFLDGYLAEVNFIDGTALDPTSFAETKSGVWVAKAYSGSYGTNGFHLEFANSGSLGADTSGNSNNFTANNLAATDQVLDSPTNNFATWNPLAFYSTSYIPTLNQGNLGFVSPSAIGTRSSMAMSTGTWYAEVLATSTDNMIGIYRGTNSLSSSNSYLGHQPDGYGYFSNNGNKYNSGSNTAYGSSFTSGDIIGVAFDADNGTLTFYKNGVSQGAAFTGLSSGDYFFSFGSGTSTGVANFGQDSSFAGNKTAQGNTDANGQGDFYYTPPSGYLALCSANLPVAEGVDPANDNSPQDYFNTSLWTGNDTQRSITGVGFQPDFVWIKYRSRDGSHTLLDSIRGASVRLYSNLTNAEDANNGLISFDADGYTMGNNATSHNMNESGQTVVGWSWLAGNGTSVNTDGSINSTVSVSQAAGFSIVNYTGTAANATVGHGLGATPAMYFVKNRDQTGDWCVYHKDSSATPQNVYAQLNLANAFGANSTIWNNTAPTSTTFSIGSYLYGNNIDYIAYCFAPVEGFSAFGKYSGNGSTNGPFIYTGHRPAFVLMKHINGSNNWLIYDDERLGYNQLNNFLYPNQSQKEDVASDFPRIDILSNGFKLINNYGDINGSGGEYLYATFARNPFKYALAR